MTLRGTELWFQELSLLGYVVVFYKKHILYKLHVLVQPGYPWVGTRTSSSWCSQYDSY